MDNEEMRIGFLDSLGFFWKDFKRSPGKTYRKVKGGRDWLLGKICLLYTSPSPRD